MVTSDLLKQKKNIKLTMLKEKKATSKPGTATGDRVYTNGKPILGKLHELGELIFKFNMKDQADKYIRTRLALADYVGVQYGKKTERVSEVWYGSHLYQT